MRKYLAKLGRIRLVALLTLLAMILAVLFNCIILLIQNNPITIDALIRSFIIPIIIAPLLSWALVGLYLRIDELEKQMHEWALYDQLTGLLSRRAFLQRAEQTYSFSQRHNQQFCVLILDLDHFKKINDQYGHHIGDIVLEDFGDMVKASIRKSDIAGRLGGEEFGFILPNTNIIEADNFCEKLLHTIRNRTVITNDKAIHYTASIGIASYTPDQELPIEQLLYKADKALYQAKDGGRNQFIRAA